MVSFLKKKRAQAAIELLTTYGWAIMGVLIVIGALSYFDVFDGDRFVSERCDTGSQIQCLEAYANDEGQFQLSLRNNYLVPIMIAGVSVNDVPLCSDGCCDCAYKMTSGNVTIFTAENVDGLVKGDKKSMDIRIVFKRNDSGIDHDSCYDESLHPDGGMCYNISGTLVVKVQDAAEGIGPLTQ